MTNRLQTKREFQVFAKPAGAACNLACGYCYYRFPANRTVPAIPAVMPADLLETYIRQQIEASPEATIRFAWHGGEPTLAGLDYFRRLVTLQQRCQPPHREIINGIQTNGTLLNEDWCRFLADEGFRVGLSLDGPEAIHDRHRVGKAGGPTFARVMRGFDLLQLYDIPTDMLCVVTSQSVHRAEQIYAFFKRLGATSVSLLPLVKRRSADDRSVTPDSVAAQDFGKFLCAIFDAWKRHDIGRVQIELFTETARTAAGHLPATCVFRPTCGDVPVIEKNGDVYACDHFVTARHRLGNIRDTHLGVLVQSALQRKFGRAKQTALPGYCRSCRHLAQCNGGCPKDRFISAPDGEPGLNYLCAGYQRFFNHCRPFVTALATLQQRPFNNSTPTADSEIGRNSPCPCGSGRKYKRCCMAG